MEVTANSFHQEHKRALRQGFRKFSTVRDHLGPLKTVCTVGLILYKRKMSELTSSASRQPNGFSVTQTCHKKTMVTIFNYILLTIEHFSIQCFKAVSDAVERGSKPKPKRCCCCEAASQVGQGFLCEACRGFPLVLSNCEQLQIYLKTL